MDRSRRWSPTRGGLAGYLVWDRFPNQRSDSGRYYRSYRAIRPRQRAVASHRLPLPLLGSSRKNTEICSSNPKRFLFGSARRIGGQRGLWSNECLVRAEYVGTLPRNTGFDRVGLVGSFPGIVHAATSKRTFIGCNNGYFLHPGNPMAGTKNQRTQIHPRLGAGAFDPGGRGDLDLQPNERGPFGLRFAQTIGVFGVPRDLAANRVRFKDFWRFPASDRSCSGPWSTNSGGHRWFGSDP